MATSKTYMVWVGGPDEWVWNRSEVYASSADSAREVAVSFKLVHADEIVYVRAVGESLVTQYMPPVV